ncbi:MAG: sigma 54-interacting transcriptional regulator [Thermoguttaceae bacterium]|jgi:DNA-binding NtrC family response regulator
MVESAAMREVLNLAAKIAAGNAAVLICGESGVGKQSIAHEIHRASRFAGGPFVHVPCDGISEPTLERRLFGVRAGDASETAQDVRSLLQTARGGTLFLDEVGRLPFWALVRLFDIFQQTNLGLPEDSFRVIASTSSNLEAATADGRFYSGLYHYLNVAQVNVPPLRQRPEDIRKLAEYFLAAAGSVQGQDASAVRRRFSDEAWQSLLTYEWPGNIPELSSVVARVAILTDEELIGPEFVAKALGKGRPKGDSGRIAVPGGGSLKEIELVVIEETLRRCGGNKAAASRALGLHRRTLYRILERGDRESGPHRPPPEGGG